MAKQKEHPWKDVKSVLAQKDDKELLKLIQQLYSFSTDNKRFINTKYGLTNPIEPYKEIICTYIDPDPMSGCAEPISLSKGRKAISEYRKAVGDTKGLLDLMIYYVECGTNQTLVYGDMWEEFYDSMESMYAKAINLLKKSDPSLSVLFLPRLRDIVDKTKGMGWGYHDGLMDTLFTAFPDAQEEIK